MSSKDQVTRVSPKGRLGQVGPWLPQETLLLELSYQGTALVKIAATSQNFASQGVSSYAASTEYWSLGNLTPLTQGIDELHLRITSASLGPSDLDGFLFPNPIAFN